MWFRSSTPIFLFTLLYTSSAFSQYSLSRDYLFSNETPSPIKFAIHRIVDRNRSCLSQTTKPSELSAKELPCVAYTTVQDGSVEFIVIGTSHLPCNSATEVSSLIKQERPDGVVVELDPERVILLTNQTTGILQSNSNDSDEATTPAEIDSKKKFYQGEDLLAAIDTSRDMNIPLFIGDEYTKETVSRFVATALQGRTYSPKNLFRFIFQSDTSSDKSIQFLETFSSDSKKSRSLLLSLPSLLYLPGAIYTFPFHNVPAILDTFAVSVLSFVAVCKVFNVLIEDRNEILASKAMKAARVISSLKNDEIVRKRWTFSTVNNDDIEQNWKQDDGNESDKRNVSNTLKGTPLFTLKTPLRPGETRRLNLFEPRWLKMIDMVYYNKSSLDSSSAADISSPLFGCVTCPNKFYSATSIGGNEGRYADVIFSPQGTLAAIVDLKEDSRPSGARKVVVTIEGREAFEVKKDDVSVATDGYMVASKLSPVAGDPMRPTDSFLPVTSSKCEKEVIKIVVVVGLLHAKGVIERLARV